MVSSWEWHAYFSLGHLCPKISKRHKHFLGSVHTSHYTAQCTEVRFASFFSGGFTTMAVINPPENKLAKYTSVLWCVFNNSSLLGTKICQILTHKATEINSLVSVGCWSSQGLTKKFQQVFFDFQKGVYTLKKKSQMSNS